LEPVKLPDLRVPVAVGRVRELDRHERIGIRPVAAWSVAQQLRDQLLADHPREQIVDDHPLVVPGQRAAGLIEQLGLAHAIRPQPVDQPAVGADERDLHLAHEHVRVVPGIADQPDALLVAWDVAVVLEQLRRIAAAEQVRRPDRPTAVQRLEVPARRAHVGQRGEVHVGARR
jgi:hypothetical protein